MKRGRRIDEGLTPRCVEITNEIDKTRRQSFTTYVPPHRRANNPGVPISWHGTKKNASKKVTLAKQPEFLNKNEDQS